MSPFVRDIASTVVMVVTLAVYATTHEGWDVWLIGDHHRWAAVVILLLAIALHALVTPALHGGDRALDVTTSLGLVLAAAAVASGALAPLSLLVAVMTVVWFAAAATNAWRALGPPGQLAA